MLPKMPLLELEELRDEDLLARCRDGDEFAWETLVNRYQRLVFSIPRRAGLNSDDCAEVFQEVFTALVRKLDDIDRPERLHAWLVTTARRKTSRLILKFRHIQQTNQSQPVQEDGKRERDAPDNAPLPDEALVRLEQQHHIWTAMSALDDRCRKLLVALFYHQEPPSYAELARSLDISEGSIGPTRGRCLEKLMRLIEK